MKPSLVPLQKHLLDGCTIDPPCQTAISGEHIVSQRDTMFFSLHQSCWCVIWHRNIDVCCYMFPGSTTWSFWCLWSHCLRYKLVKLELYSCIYCRCLHYAELNCTCFCLLIIIRYFSYVAYKRKHGLMDTLWHYFLFVFRLAHLQYESLLFWSSYLLSVVWLLFVCHLSVPRQISKTKRDTREILSPL